MEIDDPVLTLLYEIRDEIRLMSSRIVRLDTSSSAAVGDAARSCPARGDVVNETMELTRQYLAEAREILESLGETATSSETKLDT